MATDVHLLPWHIKPAVKLLRPVIVDGPIVATGDRFLVTEAALDMQQHRLRLRCEQLSFDLAVVVGLILDERWDMDLQSPLRTIKDERWELVLTEPDAEFHDERWDMVLGDPTTQFFNELWENTEEDF